MASPGKRQVLLLCFEYRDYLDEMYGWLFGKVLGVELVSSAELPGGTVRSALPEPYSMKALHVKDARVQERMYVAAEMDSMTENRIFAAVFVDRSQPAVAAANIGQGYLVYCGDANGEHESSQLMLALCGFKVESD